MSPLQPHRSLPYPGLEPKGGKVPRWYRYERDDMKFKRQKWEILPTRLSSETVVKKKTYLRSLPFGIQNKLRKPKPEEAAVEPEEVKTSEKVESKSKKKSKKEAKKVEKTDQKEKETKPENN